MSRLKENYEEGEGGRVPAGHTIRYEKQTTGTSTIDMYILTFLLRFATRSGLCGNYAKSSSSQSSRMSSDTTVNRELTTGETGVWGVFSAYSNGSTDAPMASLS